ncbi:unnamed protein product [Arctia plantaginis]|uniref:CLIP domain-containing serine protease n=1 Tax=Arctia plantaginis TaxID=874455 RepID=A0A8S0ZZ85_ARCPL|nr:unnamed protein product [Arctia plantaginis]
MNYVSILFAFFAPPYVVFAQQGPCEIPLNGGQGQCKSIFKCQPLLSLVNQAEKKLQEKDLLHRSYCGIDDDTPAVCCPKHNETQPCITPEGKPGQCISLYSCSQFTTLLMQPLTNDIREFVRISKCDGMDQYSVCCGPIPNFDIVKGNCTLTAFPPDPRTECCGVDSRYQNKILGGTATDIDQYPWLAMLELNKNGKQRSFGMGALISGKYVVTTASIAVSDTFGKIVNIVLGEYDTSNEGPDCVEVDGGGVDCTEGAIKIPVERIIPHPQFNAKERINDISLIRMKQNAPYTDFIRPICLPTADVTLKSEHFYLRAAGWGTISVRQSSTNIKHHVFVPHVSRDQCQSAYSSRPRLVEIRETHLCAGGDEGRDTCKGDGTLMYKNGITYEYAGIVSFGAVPCGLKDVPTVYTNVYKYNNWIRNNIVP